MRLSAEEGRARMRHRSSAGTGWGPFTSRQLTTIVCVAIVAVVAIPTAAIAAAGSFTTSTAPAAVVAVNSGTAAGAKGVQGIANATNTNGRYGVTGNASGANGVGVNGTGTKYGVFSNGPLGVAFGKPLSCAGCVGVDALSNAAGRTRAYAYVNADGTITSSRNVDTIEHYAPGRYCVMLSQNLDANNTILQPVITVSDTSPHFTNTPWTATFTYDHGAISDACSPNAQFGVFLWQDTGGTFATADSDWTIVVP